MWINEATPVTISAMVTLRVSMSMDAPTVKPPMVIQSHRGTTTAR